MKLLAFVLAILLVQLESKYIAFGGQTVNAIFQDKKNTFILFTTPSDTQLSSRFVASSASDAEHLYTTIDKQQNADHFNRFGEFLGINVQNTPILVYLVDATKKYIGDASDLSVESLAAFIARVEAGEIKQHLKSAHIPTQSTSAVKTIVGNNFQKEVLETEKQVLLKIYAPWCGHCITIAPDFDAAAQAIAHNPNIVLADFDGSLNQYEGLQYSSFPTIYWYAIDKTVPPLIYNGERDREGILTYIQDHTQYDWIEPKESQREEL